MSDNPKAGALPHDDVHSIGLGRSAEATLFDPHQPSADTTVLDPAATPAPARAANEPRRVLAPKPAAASITLPAGYRLFEYRIDSILGQGGFGIAYAATDVNLAAKVVIKEYL